MRPGTIFGLLGPNGAGKSTTVRILTTLSRPDSGTARVAGIDVLAEPVRVRHAIGVVAQKHGLDPEATGRENLVLQGEFYAITGARPARSRRRGARALRARRRRRPPARPTRAGCSAGSTWPWASSTGPRSCSSTSRPPGWIPRRGPSIWHEIERLARDER